MTVQPSPQPDTKPCSRWIRFWHAPLAAERLAGVRIAVAAVLLADQLFQYLPFLAYLFGADGVAPAGVNEDYLLRYWRWPILLFHTDAMTIVGGVFALWIAATTAMLLGWRTRAATFLVWLGAMCFLAKNPNVKNGGDDLMQVAVFLLMISPCGRALSLDWLRQIRREQRNDQPVPEATLWPKISPWPIRLLQIQLCVMYCVTGIAKLGGASWRDGTSIHNVLNDVTMARWSFAQFPLPFPITAAMTYATLVWEVFFPLLVLVPATRKWTLWFGVSFHVGIWITIEVGWFSFYSLAFYAAWIPAEYWNRFRPARLR